MAKKFSQLSSYFQKTLSGLKSQSRVKLALLGFLAVALPLTVLVSMQQQDLRQRASEIPATAPATDFVFKRAAEFRGGYLTVLNSVGLQAKLGFTIETWLKPEIKDLNTGTLLSKEVQGQDSFGLSVSIEKNKDKDTYFTTFVFSVADNATENCYEYAATYYMPDATAAEIAKWHHLAGVIQPSGKMEIFLNGEKAARTHTLRGTCPRSLPVGVGARLWNPPSSFYYGMLDEVRISSTARYADNFTPVLEPFIPDSSTQLLWHFDDSTEDASAFGRSGQITGNVGYVYSTIVPPVSTPSATLTPIPSEGLTITPLLTQSPTATPSSTLEATRIRASEQLIRIRLKQGERKDAVKIISTGATSFRVLGKPATTDQNINWVNRVGKFSGKQPVTLTISTGTKTKPGVYKGTAVITDPSMPKSTPLSIPVTVTVVKK